MSKGYRYLCGVDAGDCTGSNVAVASTLAGTKSHSTRKEAMLCMKKHLIRKGYEQLGQREFKSPDDGTVLVLAKESRFGGRIRRGKENRWMKDRDTGSVY